MVRTFALAGALLCGELATGCKTAPPDIKPSGEMKVQLEVENKTSTFAVKRLHLLEVTLPPIRPEYHWTISFHDTRYLKLVHEIKAPVNPADGATVAFIVLGTGRTRLRFVLLPSNGARSVEPIDQQELILTIE